MNVMKRFFIRCLKVLSGSVLLYRTKWYKSFFIDPTHEIYPDNTWYREHDERNFDLVNLGSSGGKWAFDYSGTNVKAMNWAQQPQTLLEDYNLLRHFHSILKQGGYVLITIMPFTGLNKKTGVRDAMKYVKFDLQGEPIQPYLLKKAKLYASFPILFKMQAIKALVKYIIGKERNITPNPKSMMESNPMSAEQLEHDAQGWINGWKRQFGISDLDAPLTLENEEGREYRVKLMRELIDFCVERSYKPVYVIPPVTEHLGKFYTPTFEKTYIYDYLKSVDRNVITLDYSKDTKFRSDDSLYFNSFFLNKRGRRIFTDQVLNDLGIIHTC